MAKSDKFYTNLILSGLLIILIIFYVDFRRLKRRVKVYINSNNSNKLTSLLRQFVVQNDNIVDISGVKFYVPYYPVDVIQRIIVENNEFFEQGTILAESNKYLNKDSVILDIGANIGNHTLYWNKISKVKKVYAFEPVDNTYEILKKNIEINNINSDSISINHAGLGDMVGRASIDGSYDFGNIGRTSIKMDNTGDLNVTTLDKFIKENFTENKIDLIKIDVEGFEYQVLVGAKETLTKYNPTIIIESFSDKFEQVNSLLNEYGYQMVKELPESNYVYIKKKLNRD